MAASPAATVCPTCWSKPAMDTTWRERVGEKRRKRRERKERNGFEINMVCTLGILFNWCECFMSGYLSRG